MILDSLGCDVIEINCEKPTGNLPEEQSHFQKTYMTLKSAVLNHKEDVGFAVDPDADRLAIVNEKGKR